MPEGFLLSRIVLQFDPGYEAVCEDLSAVVCTPEGDLWTASDETTTLERLSYVEPYTYGKHKQFTIADLVDLPDQDDLEIDIEGMDYANNYLWFTGSHGTKRKKPKDSKSDKKNLERLAEISFEPNRYIIGRIPLIKGELLKSCTHPDNSDQKLTAATLECTDGGNLLIEALKSDQHLGPFLSTNTQAQAKPILLPGKDNGFDIEGLVVHGDRMFLGLRGPVLRGWAIILEIELEQISPTQLRLKPIGKSDQPYKKHFVNLGGLGIRDLCLRGNDLLILAGPTMVLDGSIRVFRLRNALDLSENSLCEQAEGELELLFDIPYGIGCDRAEGMTLFACIGDVKSLLVVYDAPSEVRQRGLNGTLADVFRLS